jgi:hypothetical protein
MNETSGRHRLSVHDRKSGQCHGPELTEHLRGTPRCSRSGRRGR